MEGIKHEKQPTPQLVLEAIKRKFSTSREFMAEVVSSSKEHRAHSGKPDVAGVIAKLASIRTNTYGSEGEGLSPNDESVTPDRAKEIWHEATNFGFLVAAVYHGEATFVGENGELLNAPRNFN